MKLVGMLSSGQKSLDVVPPKMKLTSPLAPLPTPDPCLIVPSEMTSLPFLLSSGSIASAADQ